MDPKRLELVEEVVRAADRLVERDIAPHPPEDRTTESHALKVATDALRAIDALAAPGLKWGCRVVQSKRESTYFNVVTACGKYALCGGVSIAASWNEIKDGRGADYFGGIYKDESQALTALASAPPPPGWVEPTTTDATCPSTPATETTPPGWHTVTGADVLRVLDALPHDATVSIWTIGTKPFNGVVWSVTGMPCVLVEGHRDGHRDDIESMYFRLSLLPASFDRASIGLPTAQAVSATNPMDCECATWAHERMRSEDLLNHHPRCPRRKEHDGVAQFAIDVLAALRWWGSQEDGIPDEPVVNKAYETALTMSGERGRSPTADDATPAQDGAKGEVTREEFDTLRREVDLLHEQRRVESERATPAPAPKAARYEVVPIPRADGLCTVMDNKTGDTLANDGLWSSEGGTRIAFDHHIALAVCRALNGEVSNDRAV